MNELSSKKKELMIAWKPLVWCNLLPYYVHANHLFTPLLLTCQSFIYSPITYMPIIYFLPYYVHANHVFPPLLRTCRSFIMVGYFLRTYLRRLMQKYLIGLQDFRPCKIKCNFIWLMTVLDEGPYNILSNYSIAIGLCVAELSHNLHLKRKQFFINYRSYLYAFRNC